MPYKMFCDQCNGETSHNWVSNRALVSFEGWKAEIMIAKDGVYNGGILCRTCLDKILKTGAYEGKNVQTWK